MPITHLFLTLLVVVIWGINFLFVKLSLDEMSPLLLCATRFLLASVPAIFFIKPPAITFKIVALYGIIMFALQFSFLFMGMHAGMTPGMASLVMQIQIFFSMLFAALFLGELPSPWQILGALVSFMGIVLVAMHLDKNVTLLGFLFILAAAAIWGIGNLITKKINNINMIALVIWGSFFASIPMLILLLVTEGKASILYTYYHLSFKGASSVFYIVYLSTWVGYGAWNWLLNRHPVATIVPFTLLIPMVGMMSSILILGETLDRWKIIAGLLVISGLCINLFGARFLTKKMQPALQE